MSTFGFSHIRNNLSLPKALSYNSVSAALTVYDFLKGEYEKVSVLPQLVFSYENISLKPAFISSTTSMYDKYGRTRRVGSCS